MGKGAGMVEGGVVYVTTFEANASTTPSASAGPMMESSVLLISGIAMRASKWSDICCIATNNCSSCSAVIASFIWREGLLLAGSYLDVKLSL